MHVVRQTRSKTKKLQEHQIQLRPGARRRPGFFAFPQGGDSGVDGRVTDRLTAFDPYCKPPVKPNRYAVARTKSLRDV